MLREAMPILVGAVLGGVLVMILLGTSATESRSSAGPTDVDDGSSVVIGTLASDLPVPESDTVMTLDQLPAIADPFARRAAALALLDDHDADRVAEWLSPAEATLFRIDAIVRSAAADPARALAEAMALPERAQQGLALARLAAVLGESDPLRALAAIDGSGTPELEAEFTLALLDTWAAYDPAGVFAYLDAAGGTRVPVAEFALAALAAHDPERLFDLAPALPPDIGRAARKAAFESLIQQDVAAALQRLNELAPGSDRSDVERAAAQVYGAQDPAAAWTWAQDSDADVIVRVAVLSGIQESDPDLAWNLLWSELSSGNAEVRAQTRQYLLNFVYSVLNSDTPEQKLAVLDNLVGLNDPEIDAAMRSNISAWAERSPEEALEWSLRNLERINAPAVLSSLSRGLAGSNVDLARQTLFRLEDAARIPWVAGVGQALAAGDLPAARAWAFEFPPGSMRDAGLQEVLRAEARGGVVDRSLFDQFSDEDARDAAASRVAVGLACDGQIELARQIVAGEVVNPGLRAQTERQIEESLRTGGALGGSISGLMCLVRGQ